MSNDKQLAQESLAAKGDATSAGDFPSVEPETDREPKAVSEADAIAGFEKTLKYPASVKARERSTREPDAQLCL